MKALTLAVAFAAILLSGAAKAQVGDWQRYVVSETGTGVDLPRAVFSNDVGRPETGYGRRFLTADGRANLTVQSVPNQAGDSPAGFLAKKKPPAGIVYKKV